MVGIDFSQPFNPVSIPDFVKFCVMDTFTPRLDTMMSYMSRRGKLIALFQGYYAPAWNNSEGAARGTLATQHAKSVGYRPNHIIFLDCEESTMSDNTPWVQDWLTSVQDNGYLGGVYVGQNFNCNWEKLFGLSGLWKSVSVSDVPALLLSRNYDMYQVSDSQYSSNGLVDFDVIATAKIVDYFQEPEFITNPPVAPSTPTKVISDIPPIIKSNTYTVVSGDTLWSIATNHGMTVQSLLRLNPKIRNPNFIAVGEKINL